MTIDTDKLIRLRILQALAVAYAAPDVDGAAHGVSDWMGERAILHGLAADRDLAADIRSIRAAISYLHGVGLVVANRPGLDTMGLNGLTFSQLWVAARLTEKGKAWLDSPGEHGLAIYSPDEVPHETEYRYGPVSAIEALPMEVRAWLDQGLVRLGFRDYRGLAVALKEKGWGISKSAVHKYGQRLREQIEQRTAKAREKAELAKALSATYGDSLPEMLIGVQGIGLSAIMEAIEEREYSADRETLASLVKAIPQLGKGLFGAAAEKRAEEQRRKALEDAAKRVETSEVARGLDSGRRAELRRLITGIAA